MKILVVDDSRTMRSIIKRTLTGPMSIPEENVSEAADGVEALACHRSVQNQPPMIESKPASEVAFLILHSLPSSQDLFGPWGGLLFLGSLGSWTSLDPLGLEAALFRRR